MKKPSVRGMNILVVEDSLIQTLDLIDWLEAAGAYVVGPVSSLESAITLIATKVIDGAVIDLNLGKGPDFALAALLRAQHIPFVLATGHNEIVLPEALAGTVMLSKPYDLDLLVARLETARALARA